MLPVKARLNKAQDFAVVIRSGQRAGTRHVAVHLLLTSADDQPRAGFVVSAKVGNSVVRHRITRRLRHQILPLMTHMAPGTRVVVRALPAASSASSDQLASDLAGGIRSATAKATKRAVSHG